MLGNGLAYVAFVVTDVEATAATLVRDFDLHRTDCTVGDSQRTAPVLSVGESAFALFAPDDPFLGGPAKAGVHHIALQVDDFPAATAFVASKGLSDTTTPQVGLGGTRRLLLHAPATAHVLAYLSEPLHVQPSPAGWVERIDHIGIASSDNTTAIDVFSHRLGYALESTQTDMEVQLAVESFTSDKYGVVYHTRPAQPIGGVRVAFITVGDCELEFLQDLDPQLSVQIQHGQAGNTKQDRSAIARFIATRGPGLHHVALKVKNISQALETLAQAGHTLIDTVGRPGSRRSHIAFIHPKNLHGMLIHLVERPVG